MGRTATGTRALNGRLDVLCVRAERGSKPQATTPHSFDAANAFPSYATAFPPCPNAVRTLPSGPSATQATDARDEGRQPQGGNVPEYAGRVVARPSAVKGNRARSSGLLESHGLASGPHGSETATLEIVTTSPGSHALLEIGVEK